MMCFLTEFTIQNLHKKPLDIMTFPFNLSPKKSETGGSLGLPGQSYWPTWPGADPGEIQC